MSTTAQTFAFGAPGKLLNASDKHVATHPSIAINSNNQFAEVHVANGDLYLTLGEVDDPEIKLYTNNGNYVLVKIMSEADYPSVALLNNLIVVTYTGEGNNNLGLYIGQIDFSAKKVTQIQNSDITENSKHVNITTSSVAIDSNGDFIIVYEATGDGNDNVLFYITGHLDTGTGECKYISSQNSYASNSFNPTIAVNNNGFIEVHQTTLGTFFYYQLGTIAANNGKPSLTLNSAPSVATSGNSSGLYPGLNPINDAEMPSIAINSNNNIVLVFKDLAHASLFFVEGTVYFDSNSISLSRSKIYLEKYYRADSFQGKKPAVSINSSGAGIAVNGGDNGDLYGTMSIYKDRSSWMKDYSNYSLNKLCIPGAHDAAMYTLNNNTNTHGTTVGNAVTQVLNIQEQLQAGIRYFDIRPVFENENGNIVIYSGHYSDALLGGVIEGADGDSMDSILSQVSTFISTHPTEIVTLKFSHFMDRTGKYGDFFFYSDYEDHGGKKDLIDLLTTSISDKISSGNLYVAPSGGSRIADTLISNILATDKNGKVTAGTATGKVIILFDTKPLKNVKIGVNFVHSYRDLAKASEKDNSTVKLSSKDADMIVYDKYSHTEEVSVMTDSGKQPGQLFRLQQNKASGSGSNEKYNYHAGDLYLLSWTLTLSAFDTANKFIFTITQLCQYANRELATDIVKNASGKNYIITSKTFPNIILVDKADCFVTDVCLWLNEQNLFGVKS